MGIRWASSTGSTIVGSLVATAAEWLENYTTGGVEYGKIVYQFNAANLSGVLPGYYLTITGFSNALNNGTFYVVAADDTANTITIRTTTRTDATADQTGATGAGTVEDEGALKQAPSDAKQAQGFIPGEKIAAQTLNWALSNTGRVQVATADIGRSTISSSSYTAIGGEGYTVCPAKTSSAFGSTISSSTAADFTGATITPFVTASNRILVGASLSADYAGPTNGRVVLGLEGSALSNDFEFYLPQENAAVSVFNLTASASAGTRDYAAMAYESGGTANIVGTNGRTWACEFASTVAAGTAVRNATTSTTSTSFVDMTDLSITISPTNNPVLLFGKYNANPGGSASFTHAARFTDGTNNYSEWQHRYFMGSSAAHGCAIAWLTGDLNGSQTFKMQQRSLTGDSVSFSAANFIAIEITGDAKSAKPTGTCAVVDAEATITDGSTPLSHAFTPGANINYLAVLTCYSERTAGTGFLTLRIKVNGTEIIKIDHARDSASNYKSPITIAIPTGLLTSGVAQTIIATAETNDGSTTYDLKSCALFLVEAPVLTASQSGDPAEVELTDVSPGRTRVDWSSQRKCSADVALSYALYENVNAGGAVEVFSKTLTAPGTADQDCSISWLRPTDLAAGDDVVYDVRAKMASGNVIFETGYLSAAEVPNV